MVEDYYEREPERREPPERFPSNHVRWSPLLTPIAWADRVGRAVGSRPFSIRSGVLREYDRARPWADVLGSEEELAALRELVAFGARKIDDNPYLSAHGRFLLQKFARSFMGARTQILRHYHENRAFIEANGKVEAPIIVTGHPRSGTTLLQRLLSEDPAARSPYTFEMELPLPVLKAGDDPLADRRIAKAGSAHAMAKRLAKGLVEKFAESHLWSATEREECFIYMMGHNGLLVMNCPHAGAEYCDRLMAYHDKRPVFRYERVFLTMLDAYCPAESHWALKAPNYAPCFPLIFDEYPDARVVLTHRNPLVTVPSLCRLLESWCVAFDRDGTFDKHRFAGLVQTFAAGCLNTPLEHRKTHPEHDARVFDCMYEDLFADPIATVERLYAHFDMELSAEAKERMQTYLANNRQGKYGRHKYSLEEYGLSTEGLYEDFREYMETYGYSIPESFERPVALGA